MKPPILPSLHSLSLKIHPPLPLNPRESEQLLLLLKSSFRRHLNREYPSPRKDELRDRITDGLGIDSARRIVRQVATTRSGGAKLMSSAAANHHFVSILTNPLFTKGVHSSPSDHLGEGSGECSLEEARRRITDDPMGFFEENVALGTATIPLATLCLRIHMREILGSPVLSVKDGIIKSGAGTKVLKWMWSSGLSTSNDFLTNLSFVRALIPFLVLGGHSGVAWSWMNRPVLVDTHSELGAAARQKGFLLLGLIETELKYGGGVNSAVEMLQRTADRAESILASDAPNQGPPGAEAVRVFLRRAAGFLYRRCKGLSSTQDLSPKVLDAFLRIIPKFSRNHELHQAWFRMYHPTNPSTEPALKLLRSAARVGGKIYEGVKHERVKAIWIEFGLDTAGFLLKEEKWEDGAEVLNILQNSFPEGLALEHAAGVAAPRADVETDEQTNLRLLDGLDLALGWKQS
ncbi:hypothetical protein FGG08_004099 [Glutinoglossum americanum]|uniref:Uncharacterized protein n=1 Tax=Glutinoglossum americanum TaxID=1670608 RepID=A0A9P8I5R5_9PEZI|nr:hypothetical protein FGG08_004099 [Glutinoglossum americanum]